MRIPPTPRSSGGGRPGSGPGALRAHASTRGPPRAGRVPIGPLSWEFSLKAKQTGEGLVLPVLYGCQAGVARLPGPLLVGDPPPRRCSGPLRGSGVPCSSPPGGPAKPPAVRKGVRECPVGRGRRTLGGRRGLQASQCVRSPWHPDEAGTLPPPGGGVQAEGPWEEDEAGAAPIAQSSCPLEGRESSQDPGPQGATEPASQRAAGCWACRVQRGLCAPERRWGACGEPGSGAAGHRDPISRQLQ